MKVSYTRKVRDRLEWYMKRKEIETYLIEMLVTPISEGAFIDENEEDMKKLVDDFRTRAVAENIEYTEDQLVMGSFVFSLVNSFLMNNGGAAPSSIELMEKSIHETVLNSRVLHADDIDNNSFLKNIQFDVKSISRTKHGFDTYKKYGLLLYDSLLLNENDINIPRIAILDHEHSFPCIIKGDQIITNSVVSPYCINTKAKAVEEADGKVLVLGCEIGYFAYMVSQKPNVSKVVIVENDPEIIDLFESSILPQFTNKDKITVIETDPYEYMKDLDDGSYDYCFAQLWVNATGLDDYIKLKNICRKFRKTDVVYWLENEILRTAMSFVVSVLRQSALKNKGLKLNLTEEDQYIFDIIDEILNGESITNASDVDYYMDYRNILKLLENKYNLS